MCLLIGFGYLKTFNWAILMTLSIKSHGYVFLIGLDLMISMSLWKEFHLL